MVSVHKTIQEIKNITSQATRPIGFVPTMGALHPGHESLIRTCRDECKTVVVSIFVNPLQFGPGEDFEKYPRDLKRDLNICEENKVDYLFVPDEREIYPDTNKIEFIHPPEELTNILCGKKRKDHFSGVATVVKKLFSIVEPDYAYFGEKDLQQLYIVRWLVKTFQLPVFVRGCPIIREVNGLAFSSRNRYLNPEQQELASNVYKSLLLARRNVRSGIFTVNKAILESLIFLSQFPEIKVEYFEARDKENLEPVKENKVKGFYFLTAVHLYGVRLIDNIEV